IFGIDLLDDVHAADLDEAAERDRRELEHGAGLLRATLEQAGTKPDAESLDAHAAPAGHEVVAALVHHDQEAQREDREQRVHVELMIADYARRPAREANARSRPTAD